MHTKVDRLGKVGFSWPLCGSCWFGKHLKTNIESCSRLVEAAEDDLVIAKISGTLKRGSKLGALVVKETKKQKKIMKKYVPGQDSNLQLEVEPAGLRARGVMIYRELGARHKPSQPANRLAHG